MSTFKDLIGEFRSVIASDSLTADRKGDSELLRMFMLLYETEQVEVAYRYLCDQGRDVFKPEILAPPLEVVAFEAGPAEATHSRDLLYWSYTSLTAHIGVHGVKLFSVPPEDMHKAMHHFSVKVARRILKALGESELDWGAEKALEAVKAKEEWLECPDQLREDRLNTQVQRLYFECAGIEMWVEHPEPDPDLGELRGRAEERLRVLCFLRMILESGHYLENGHYTVWSAFYDMVETDEYLTGLTYQALNVLFKEHLIESFFKNPLQEKI